MCDNCNNKDGLTRVCNRCGASLCCDCLQIENHKCKPIERSWSEYANWQKKLTTVKGGNFV